MEKENNKEANKEPIVQKEEMKEQSSKDNIFPVSDVDNSDIIQIARSRNESIDQIPVPKKVETPKKVSDYELINQDPSLKQYEGTIKHRNDLFKKQLEEIEKNEGSLEAFAQGYKQLGLNKTKDNDIIYREYAPGAKSISIVSLQFINASITV